jgi:hypothetical protein
VVTGRSLRCICGSFSLLKTKWIFDNFIWKIYLKLELLFVSNVSK